MLFIDWPSWEIGIKAPYNIHWDWKTATAVGSICPGTHRGQLAIYEVEKVVLNDPENLRIVTGIGRIAVKALSMRAKEFFFPSVEVTQWMHPLLMEFSGSKVWICQ